MLYFIFRLRTPVNHRERTCAEVQTGQRQDRPMPNPLCFFFYEVIQTKRKLTPPVSLRGVCRWYAGGDPHTASLCCAFGDRLGSGRQAKAPGWVMDTWGLLGKCHTSRSHTCGGVDVLSCSADPKWSHQDDELEAVCVSSFSAGAGGMMGQFSGHVHTNTSCFMWGHVLTLLWLLVGSAALHLADMSGCHFDQVGGGG